MVLLPHPKEEEVNGEIKGSRFWFLKFLHPGNTEASYFWEDYYLDIPGSGYDDLMIEG